MRSWRTKARQSIARFLAPQIATPWDVESMSQQMQLRLRNRWS